MNRWLRLFAADDRAIWGVVQAAGEGGALPPLAAAVAAGLAVLVAAAALALALWMRRQRRDPARRIGRSGLALLGLAREIDTYAQSLELAGHSAIEQRRWARQCRRLAGERLDCVNALMLEALRRDTGASR
ncbi:hypothetical protein [Lysobacter silvisoli]|uniref:DUF4381 family protein n=1 Tax=Lysobacter silvisoli TaxID=2293254 RepID=A0A371K405_9GAMM|nr:hypothetical protein [Lysobacter silvisoli]RDZ28661.1 hypothetical protein DX914_05915 [Lysobacter silvisoli]